ncbi:hypothetical protein EYZ11_007753 [Aspergillus tanneri]|nr:hypothetical protein EYZ11_007753 [Aspergillus tanneri]
MDTVLHIQGSPDSPRTPLILVHAVSGLALPYFALGPLGGRPVYGISAPVYEHGSKSPMPSSLAAVAALYVSIVRRDIQPKGPYLLGGWSMGGMIAIEMARILSAEGEAVSHVVMIDSLNPELYPPFYDAREHNLLATLTYNAIARRMNAPEDLTSVSLLDEDISSSSSSNSTSRENSDGEIDSDEDEDDIMDRFYERLRQHIHQGLRMLGTYRSTVPLSQRPSLPETDVTLIKCETLGTISPLLRESRRTFAKKIHRDGRNGWPEGRFKSLSTVPFRAMHDGCFDQEFADELTGILKRILDRVG